MADLFNFLFVRSKRVSSLVFVLSGGYSCYFDEDVHPFTSSLILSIQLFLLHLRIPISSSSLLLYFVSSFISSTLRFLPHLGNLISSSSLLFIFNYSFVFSKSLFLLPLRIPIYFSSILLDSLHEPVFTLEFDL